MKLKHRLTTLALVFTFPVFMAAAFTIDDGDTPAELFLLVFAACFGLESMFLVLGWFCYEIWKGE